MKRHLITAVVSAVLAVTGTAVSGFGSTSKTVTVHKQGPAQVLYIRNLAPRYFSDAQIRHDIPAWQQAVNVDFAKYWRTLPFRLVFIGKQKAPVGAMVATFVKSGPVKGALAYHSVDGGAPSITVYSGTGAYYGYDNSVSFTHELFELAADPNISGTNQGWPYDWVYIFHPDGSVGRTPQNEGTVWAQEVCDPVEADFYRIGDVTISDFVTPAWFNDGIAEPNDFMGLAPQPFSIMPGGYAQFFDGFQWNVITNFRHADASDRGFYLGEQNSIR